MVLRDSKASTKILLLKRMLPVSWLFIFDMFSVWYCTHRLYLVAQK